MNIQILFFIVLGVFIGFTIEVTTKSVYDSEPLKKALIGGFLGFIIGVIVLLK